MHPIVGGSGRVALETFKRENEGNKSGAQHKNESNAGHPPQNSDKTPRAHFPIRKMRTLPSASLQFEISLAARGSFDLKGKTDG